MIEKSDIPYSDSPSDNVNNIAESFDNSKEIGKTVVSEKTPITIDEFWFAIRSDRVLGVLDFVSVENLHKTRTIGIIKDLQTVKISESSFHDDDPAISKPSIDISQYYEDMVDKGITVARVAIMANTGYNRNDRNFSISMPVQTNKSVRFANLEEVIFALGIPEMEYPIPAGLIEMTDGLQVPVSLATSYLVGPDTAHVNASGISGNMKTSYLLFLLQSTYQRLRENRENNDVAVIIFNTKEEDLLHIDKRPDQITKRNEMLHDILQLGAEPFQNVTYFFPRGSDGKPNSMHRQSASTSPAVGNYKTYSYELQDVYDRLELLYPETYDPHYNVSAIIDYIYESWPLRNKSGKTIKTWSKLLEFKKYPNEIITHKSTLLHFIGHLQRFRKSSLFIDKRVSSVYLGRQINQIKAGEVFVIDLALISSLEEQAFIVGDVIKTINDMFSSSSQLYVHGTHTYRPKYLLVFIDEINRFIPHNNNALIRSAVAEQIKKFVIAGKSRKTILFSAQQFKSTVDNTLHENCGLHIIAKMGMSELASTPYNIIDENTKRDIVRLNKGEIVMIHPAFSHPIKITFPKAAFKRR